MMMKAAPHHFFEAGILNIHYGNWELPQCDLSDPL